MLTPYLLALFAVLLAWPVPLWLQRAKWPSRAPGATLVLWQAIGLSGGLALVSAPLTWGLQPFGSGVLSAGSELLQVFRNDGVAGVFNDARWEPLGLAAVTLSGILFGHLTLVLFHTAFTTVRQRKKHREFVELLSASLQDHDHGLGDASQTANTTRVLPVEHPLAYCLPAAQESITVVSRGLLNQLSAQQLSAVLAHESAHLTQRHDLLRLVFQAWHKAVPWFPATSVAVDEVTELTEIMADDVALTQHQTRDLTSALAHTLEQQGQDTDPQKTPQDQRPAPVASRRLRRLIGPRKPLGSCRVSLVIILSGLLVIGPAFVSLV